MQGFQIVGTHREILEISGITINKDLKILSKMPGFSQNLKLSAVRTMLNGKKN